MALDAVEFIGGESFLAYTSNNNLVNRIDKLAEHKAVRIAAFASTRSALA